MIRSGCLKVPSHTADLIRDLGPQKKITELCSFLAWCNVSRLFVRNLGRIADQINKELCKCEPTTFENLEETKPLVLRALQEKLTSSPVLALPRSQGAGAAIRSTPTSVRNRLVVSCYNSNRMDTATLSATSHNLSVPRNGYVTIQRE